MGIDLRQRYIKDFLKVGRIGNQYYVFGAPEGREGPYDNPQQAEDVYTNIVANFEEYEVVNRKVVRKESK